MKNFYGYAVIQFNLIDMMKLIFNSISLNIIQCDIIQCDIIQCDIIQCVVIQFNQIRYIYDETHFVFNPIPWNLI